jgi:hypothetical protein
MRSRNIMKFTWKSAYRAISYARQPNDVAGLRVEYAEERGRTS